MLSEVLTKYFSKRNIDFSTVTNGVDCRINECLAPSRVAFCSYICSIACELRSVRSISVLATMDAVHPGSLYDLPLAVLPKVGPKLGHQHGPDEAAAGGLTATGSVRSTRRATCTSCVRREAAVWAVSPVPVFVSGPVLLDVRRRLPSASSAFNSETSAAADPAGPTLMTVSAGRNG